MEKERAIVSTRKNSMAGACKECTFYFLQLLTLKNIVRHFKKIMRSTSSNLCTKLKFISGSITYQRFFWIFVIIFCNLMVKRV